MIFIISKMKLSKKIFKSVRKSRFEFFIISYDNGIHHLISMLHDEEDESSSSSGVQTTNFEALKIYHDGIFKNSLDLE